MRRGLTLAFAVILAGATMGAQSCGTTTKTTGAKTKLRARVGDPITLQGQDSGERVEVRPLRVIDPVNGGEGESPDPGKRFVGVMVELRNVGSKAFSDSPSNDGRLVLQDGSLASSTILGSGDCSGDFTSSVTIPPNEAERGCLPFQAPKGTAPTRFQFTLDSGFGPQAGEWTAR